MEKEKVELSSETNSTPNISEQVDGAVNDDTITEIHFNGFINALGSGDVLILLQRNGRIIGKLNTSYTVAKSLSQKLGAIIAELEQKSGNTIMTIGDIQASLDKGEADDNSK